MAKRVIDKSYENVRMGKYVFLIALVLILLLVYPEVTGKAFNQLNSEQKQVYWKCLENSGCSQLLKDKKYADYKTCSLNCMNQASQFSPEQNWCNDSDGGNDYFTKGTIKSYLYPNGKEDYGRTFGKTVYLMEGICKDNMYLWIQKNCGELGDYEYKAGACVKKEDYWDAGTELKKLEITNNNAPPDNLMGESISGITSYLSINELKSLSIGKFSIGDKEYSYLQYLFLSPPGKSMQSMDTSGMVKYTTNNIGQIAEFFYFKIGNEIASYRLEFIEPAESVVDEKMLTTFVNKKIKIFGVEYTITSAVLTSEDSKGIKLILNDGKKGLELEDDDISDDIFSTNLKVNGELTEGAEIKLKGIINGGIAKINIIEVRIIAQKDYFVSAGSKLSEAIKQAGEKPEALFTENWDIRYEGLTTETTHDIKLSAPSNNQYILTWYDGDNNKIEMPLVYAKDDQTIILGETATEKALIIKEGIPINKDDYFVVTGGNPAEGNAQSYLLQYKGTETINEDEKKIKFKDIGSGKYLEYLASQDSKTISLNLGKYSFEVIPASSTEEEDFPILVDLDVTYKNEMPAIADNIILGENPKEYLFGEDKHLVNLVYVETYGSLSAKFKIDGEFTSKLVVGESYETSSHLVVTVSDIVYQSFAGGFTWVFFNLKENPSHKGIDKDQPPIVDKYGAKISFNHYSYSESFIPLTNLFMTITTPNENAYDNQKPSEIKIGLNAVDESKININSFTMDGNSGTLITSTNEPTIASGYTSLGGKLTLTTPTDSPAEFIYQYPEKQKLPKVKIIAYSS